MDVRVLMCTCRLMIQRAVEKKAEVSDFPAAVDSAGGSQPATAAAETTETAAAPPKREPEELQAFEACQGTSKQEQPAAVDSSSTATAPLSSVYEPIPPAKDAPATYCDPPHTRLDEQRESLKTATSCVRQQASASIVAAPPASAAPSMDFSPLIATPRGADHLEALSDDEGEAAAAPAARVPTAAFTDTKTTERTEPATDPAHSAVDVHCREASAGMPVGGE
jgi:hypothetical protein